MCPLLSDLLQVVITSRLIYGAANGIVPFFPRLIFHLYMYQFFPIHLLMDFLVASLSWLL